MHTQKFKPATSIIATLVCFLTGWSALASSLENPKIGDAVKLLDIWIEEQIAYRQLPGLAVGLVHDQELIWAKGYGFTADSIFRIGSITKLFTSTAIMQLRDHNLLQLDDPVNRYLPWFKLQPTSERDIAITIRHLLTHTSGLPREAAFPYWTTHDFPERAEIIAAVREQGAVYPPATTYKYSNLGMALLGEIVASVTQQTWAEYVFRHILQPLGMTKTSAAPTEAQLSEMVTRYMRRRQDGSRQVFDYYSMNGMAAAGDMISTVRDLARFAALQFRTSDTSESMQVLKGSSLLEMQRPHWVYPSWTGGRGLGFGISHRNGKTLVSHGGWIGGSRSHLLLIPGEKLAVIAMTNADDGSPAFFTGEIYRVLGAAITGLQSPDLKSVPPSSAWNSYLGTYSDPWGWEYEVMILNGELVMYDHSYPPEERAEQSLSRLTPVSENTFLLADGEPVVFEMNEQGLVQRIKRRYEYLYPTPVESTPATSSGQ
jgi:CubicO group peptidase (beta-lactamase class C family)